MIEVFRQLSELTAPECKACIIPHHCCGKEYCEEAIDIAQRYYGVTLPRTMHPKLPLMSPTGCTAAPHFRPTCTYHTCDIASFGFKFDRKAGKPIAEWTQQYFKLRTEAERLFERTFDKQLEADFQRIMNRQNLT